MNNIIELGNTELKKYLDELYASFNTGYEFEQFLKVFLERIGLEEVFVTQKSHDGGIDLTCTKMGVAGLSNLDETKYYVQAKCFKPSSTVSIRDLRELRGVMPNNYKGIFITTAKFPSNAKEFAESDKDRPIILIDGLNLIQQCINIGLGFNFKPIFDKDELKTSLVDNTTNNLETTVPDNVPEENNENNLNAIIVSKTITQNDIRARILRIPAEIIKILPEKMNPIVVFINGEEEHLTINAERNYLARVTDVYRKYGLITSDNVFVSKLSIWKYADEKIEIQIK